MAKKTINTGSADYAGDGESIRSALIKVNENFTEVYADITAISTFSGDYNDLTNKPTIPSFDQDLNTTDSVTFNTVTTPNLVLDGDVTTLNELFIDGGAQAIGIKSQVNIVMDGNVTFQNGNINGLAGNFDGDVYGSVFGDDSTPLVDGVSNTINADRLAGTIPSNVEGRNIITHWGKLDGTTIRNSSDNFTVSVVSNDLQITFNTPMSNDDYVVNVVMDTVGQPRFSGVYSVATTGFRIQAWRVVTDFIGPGGGSVVPFQDIGIGSYSFHFMVIGT